MLKVQERLGRTFCSALTAALHGTRVTLCLHSLSGLPQDSPAGTKPCSRGLYRIEVHMHLSRERDNTLNSGSFIALVYSSSSSLSAPMSVSGTCATNHVSWFSIFPTLAYWLQTIWGRLLKGSVSKAQRKLTYFPPKRPKRPSRSGLCVGAFFSATRGSAAIAIVLCDLLCDVCLLVPLECRVDAAPRKGQCSSFTFCLATKSWPSSADALIPT